MSIFDKEDFATDFTSDSAASPLSPCSPALSASSFGFPTTDAWTSWDATELSPEPDNLFGCPSVTSCPSSNPLSPAINPMDLAIPAPLKGQSPFFKQIPQVMLPTSQRQQPAPTTAALPTPPTSSLTSPTIDAAAKRYPSRALKRKSISGSSDDEAPVKSSPTSTARRPSASKAKDPSVLGPKKTAHNMIEKRYRTNLNDKITQLRDAVPSLRLMSQRSKMAEAGGAADFDDAEDGSLAENGFGGLANGAKLNKATILSKATEYILQLERRNHGLETENSALRGRMEGLEMVLMSRGGVAGCWN